MKKSILTIVLTGGGSGGHVTPILSLAQELKRQAPDCRIVYIGHKGDKFDSVSAPGGEIDFLTFINAGKFRRYHGESLLSHLLDIKTLLLNARDLIRVIKSTISAYKILNKFRPDIVFSKGGFVAVPVGIAAHYKNIPIVTHDSDTIPGLANRIVGRWASWHATGMPPQFYPYPADKTVYTGIPLASEVKKVTPRQQAEFKKDLGLDQAKPVLLVAGGGNGSKRLNELLLSIAPELLHTHPGLNIINIAGQAHFKELAESYKAALTPQLRKQINVLGFVSDFYKYSGAADLIIARAGASSLNEFAAQAKACIIIPSPFLAGGHQVKNAEELMNREAAVVLGNDIQPDELLAVTSELLRENRRREELASRLHSLSKPGAVKTLARLIINSAKNVGGTDAKTP